MTTLTLDSPLSFSHSAGAVISSIPVTLTAPTVAGATTATVTSVTQIQTGTVVSIGGEVRTVASVSGTTLTLTAPLGLAHASGTVAAPLAEFIPAITVFSKAGALIGGISEYTISTDPSRVINGRGSMTFYVPRVSGDVALLGDDRLVAIQTELADDLWAGTMTVTDSGTGMLQVECEDIFQLLADGMPVKLTEEVEDNTTAFSMLQKVIDLANADRALNGEIQWQTDLSGTLPFLGDIDFEGNPLAAIEEITTRAGNEYIWRAALGGGVAGSSLGIWLVGRDEFSTVAGTTFSDGPGGNIVSEPRVVQDATPVINYVKLKGNATNIAKYLPQWATWAVHEVQPEVVSQVNPGTYRRRADTQVTVDWSLSKTEQRALAQATLDVIWDLYSSYLRAIHDMEGRPFHEGWKYEGPPEGFEPRKAGKDSLSRRAWRSRLQLLETNPGVPVSGVMVSDNNSQIDYREWLTVGYDRVRAAQRVVTYAIPLPSGQNLIKWTAGGGGSDGYRVSGGVVVAYQANKFTSTGAFVSAYNVKTWWPAQRKYVYLRQIINGPFALTWWISAADSNNVLVDLGPEAALNSVDESGSSFIGHIYGFEKFRIKDWDPRRDGVGQLLSKRTAWYGGVTTRPRWHVVTFDVGNNATTSLQYGVNSTNPLIDVDGILGFPDVPPFDITVDEDEAAEDMLVTAMEGAQWTVQRGQNGTAAIIHEQGAAVHRVGGFDWDGFEFPWTWAQGQAYADRLVAKLSKPQITVNIKVANIDDLWSSIKIGSVHGLNLQSEGPASGWVGNVRVRGYSTGADSGFVELLLDWLG